MVILNTLLYIWWILAMMWGIWNLSTNPPFAYILIIIWVLSFPIVYNNIKKYTDIKHFSYVYSLWLMWVFILNYILFPFQNTDISQASKVETIDNPNKIVREDTALEVTKPTYDTYSEEKKKMLFIELIKAQDRAWKEAEENFPTNWSNICPNLNDCMWKEELLQRITDNNNESERLKEIYESEFRDTFWLSIDEQKKLSSEWSSKLWPLPEY